MRGSSGMGWQCFWRSVAALLVFGQVAVAADQCPPVRLVGERAVFALAVAADHHELDAHCASDLITPDQAPGSEAKRLAPDLGLFAPTTWDLSRDAGKSWPVAYALARAGPPLRLKFRNLRL